jgi:hypothetical protein
VSVTRIEGGPEGRAPAPDGTPRGSH